MYGTSYKRVGPYREKFSVLAYYSKAKNLQRIGWAMQISFIELGFHFPSMGISSAYLYDKKK
jgi:hypothetical protein